MHEILSTLGWLCLAAFAVAVVSGAVLDMGARASQRKL